MPGAEWFPGRAPELRRARLPRARPGRAGDRARVGVAAAGRGDAGTSCATRSRAARPGCGGSASGAATASRPTCRTRRRPIVAFLACASIGAIWSSCAPEFGVPTVIDRFPQIEPKVLLAVEEYRYGGKDFDRRDRIAALQEAMPSLEHTVHGAERLGRAAVRAGRADVRAGARSTTRCGCSTRRARRGCRRRSCRGRAGSCSSTSRRLQLHLDLGPDGPLLLVHHDRLDDVELARRRAARRRDDRALGRPARPGGAVGVRRARRASPASARSAGFLTACMKAGVEPGRDHDLSRDAQPRLDRLAAAGRGLPLGLRARQAGPVAVLDERRNGRLHGVRRRLPGAAGVRRRAAGAARSARRCTRSTSTAMR